MPRFLASINNSIVILKYTIDKSKNVGFIIYILFIHSYIYAYHSQTSFKPPYYTCVTLTYSNSRSHSQLHPHPISHTLLRSHTTHTIITPIPTLTHTHSLILTITPAPTLTHSHSLTHSLTHSLIHCDR